MKKRRAWNAWDCEVREKGHGVMDGGASGGGGGGAEEASGERTAAELGPSLLCFRRDWASLAELLTEKADW
ncbi:unnamed protein product [Sphagnum troendelagicum]|jgi:hypothetical protein